MLTADPKAGAKPMDEAILSDGGGSATGSVQIFEDSTGHTLSRLPAVCGASNPAWGERVFVYRVFFWVVCGPIGAIDEVAATAWHQFIDVAIKISMVRVASLLRVVTESGKNRTLSLPVAV